MIWTKLRRLKLRKRISSFGIQLGKMGFLGGNLQDEMRPNAACCLYPNVVIRKQVPHIPHLADEHANPINGYKDIVNGEWSRMSIALSKDRMSVMVVMMWGHIIMGSVVGVVNRWNEGEEPCGDSECTIPEDVGSGYLLVAGKRVVWAIGNG